MNLTPFGALTPVKGIVACCLEEDLAELGLEPVAALFGDGGNRKGCIRKERFRKGDPRVDQLVEDGSADGRLLPSGIIPANTEFDSIRQVSRLVENAKSEIVVIDSYADATILNVLSGKRTGVAVRLVCKNRGKPTASEIAKFNRQYKGLTVSYSDDFHDRFVIIDNAELHNLDFVTAPMSETDEKEWWDIGGRQFGLFSKRYHIAFSGYAAAALGMRGTDEERRTVGKILDNCIGRVLRRDVWAYSQSKKYWGEKPWAPDPCYRENVMYTGHLLQLLALYETFTHDTKYWTQGFDFAWSTNKVVHYNVQKLIDVTVGQMRTNDYCGVTCEPGLLFFPCNNHPQIAFKRRRPAPVTIRPRPSVWRGRLMQSISCAPMASITSISDATGA